MRGRPPGRPLIAYPSAIYSFFSRFSSQASSAA
jgi:hypothetical protein